MDHRDESRCGSRRAWVRRRRLAWLLVAVASVVLSAGIAVGQGLLIAAGLFLAGAIGPMFTR